MGVSLLTRSDSQPQRFSNDTQRCQAFLTKPRSPTSSLLHHHRHHQPPGCQGPAPSPQSWTSFSTKASIWATKTRKGFSGNSTLRPEFQHLATIIQGTKLRRFSNWHLPCVLPVKALLQLPCSQLLSWLFKVRLYHQTELNFKSSVGGRQLKRDSAPEGHVITTLLNVLVLIA